MKTKMMKTYTYVETIILMLDKDKFITSKILHRNEVISVLNNTFAIFDIRRLMVSFHFVKYGCKI